VLATEGYTARLPGRERDLVPLYSLMVATEPLGDDMAAQVGARDGLTFTDGRHLLVYGQVTADGRLAFGGRGAPYHFASQIRPGYDRVPRVHAALGAALAELFPALGEVAVTHRWGGPLGVHRDWYPSVRFDRSSGIAFAGGYVGDGVATTNLAGRTLADLVLGEESDITSLCWVGHRSPRWEPEPLRYAGINAGLLAMSAADRAEARTGRPSRLAGRLERITGG
jgi:glycine/D-amino acid oxidase-like deaminating enzyme